MPDSVDELVASALRKFHSPVREGKLFTLAGGEIDELGLIRDDESLVVCPAGQTFEARSGESHPSPRHSLPGSKW